jgi:hypothetical protein
MATIVHFDLPAGDLERAASFYGKLFGWKFERVPGPIEYFGITTFDEKGNPSLGGGMGKKNEWDTYITNYVGVGSVEEALKELIELGGKVVLPRTEVGEFGYLALCLDAEGNKFGLWESKPGSPY